MTGHFSSSEVPSQVMVDVPRSSLQALKMEAIGRTPRPQVDGSQQLDCYDFVPGPGDGWLGSMRSIGAANGHANHATSRFFKHLLPTRCASMSFPKRRLTGFDSWPETDQNGSQTNPYSWPGGTDLG